MLYDQPYEDPKRIRVTGPFTVESLSPHRVLAGGQTEPAGRSRSTEPRPARPASPPSSWTTCARPACRTPSRRSACFDRLEPYAGPRSTLSASTPKTAALPARRCVHRPRVRHRRPRAFKEAAKEAVKGVGFDLLIVCGFAFDPHVAEEAKRYGKLTVLTARMNPDLAMDTPIRSSSRSTGAGNLFMVFGEPDLELRTLPDGKLAGGAARSGCLRPHHGRDPHSSTDDIACWFIDTDYNEESFFVRHAYFTGADDPTRSCSARSRPRSTRRPGRPSTAPSAAPSMRPQPARSP